MSPTADRLLIERPGLEPAVLELVEGDITKVRVDVIVNAANSALAGGSGVDGAIHRAAGPQLERELGALRGCPTGSAVVTGSGDLASRGIRKIVHAVGPIWKGGTAGEPALLESAYRKAFQLADESRARSVAFPAISAGVYGTPFPSVAEIGLRTVRDSLRTAASVERAVFVLYGVSAYGVFATALKALREG